MRSFPFPKFSLLASLALFSGTLFVCGVDAQEVEEKVQSVRFGDEKLQMDAPAEWEKVQPRVRFIEVEFAIYDSEEKNPKKGRLTIMGAGGSIEANIERWVGQFEQPDGKDTRDDATTIKEKMVASQDVTMVDISGTYLDRPIPVRPEQVTKRENYRMLAAIIATESLGNYFVKFYGPAEIVKQNEESFGAFIESLKVEDE